MKNIIITGGGMGNKGAQSMTFICASHLQKRYPEDRVVLVTLANGNYEQYRFDVVKISYPALKCAVKPIGKVQRMLKRIKQANIEQVENIYKNARMMVDISGYALGSNWADATVDYYLSCIECAKKYNVPVFVMPQSFGPFDYAKNSDMMIRIKNTMSYPKFIYVREEEGYRLLKSKFALDNLIQSCDLVLRTKSADRESIYKKIETKSISSVVPNAVAVIPNVRTFDKKDKSIVMGYYKVIVEGLLEKGRTVYLMYHSQEDRAVCMELKEQYGRERKLLVLDEELDCFEYEEIVQKFDYIVASRYHSIVHALKNGIPCIALGWAVKYHEVLTLVKQGDCVLDVRDDLKSEEIRQVLNRMDKEFAERSELIGGYIQMLQSENIFDVIAEMEGSSDAKSF